MGEYKRTGRWVKLGRVVWNHKKVNKNYVKSIKKKYKWPLNTKYWDNCEQRKRETVGGFATWHRTSPFQFIKVQFWLRTWSLQWVLGRMHDNRGSHTKVSGRAVEIQTSSLGRNWVFFSGLELSLTCAHAVSLTLALTVWLSFCYSVNISSFTPSIPSLLLILLSKSFSNSPF